jgi:hypothetical protein
MPTGAGLRHVWRAGDAIRARRCGVVAVDLLRLIAAPRAELERLVRDSPAGPIPIGRGRGRLLLGAVAGTNRAAAWYARHALRQGKVFDPRRGALGNPVTPLGIEAIVATVYPGPSRSDGKPCIVPSYARTSLVARRVRDEIRLVAPDLVRGVAYLGRVKAAPDV